jgi:hypothetical protein
LLYLARTMPALIPVAKAWPKLLEPIKAGILAMVKATAAGRVGKKGGW